jgi:lipoprotein NlpI
MIVGISLRLGRMAGQFGTVVHDGGGTDMAGRWLRRTALALAEATQDAWFFPRLADTYYTRGAIYLINERFDNAVADFSQVIRRNPRAFLAYHNRGIAFQGRDEHRLALADLQSALSLARDYPGLHRYLPLLHVNRAISYKMLGEFDRALTENELALRVNPRFAAAYGERGVVHQAEGRLAEGMDDLDTALRLEPHDAAALRCRGYGYFYAADFARAAADLERSLARQPEAYAAIMLHLVRARAGREDPAELWRHTQALQSTDWPLPIIALLLRNRTVEVVMQQASTDAQRGEVAFYIGQMQLLAGKEDEAAGWFERALAGCLPAYVEHIGARAELSRLRLRTG